MGSRLVPVNDLMTIDDIAQEWKMSIGHVKNLVEGRNGRRKVKFPTPLRGRGTRAVWLRPELEEWYCRVNPHQREQEKRAAKQARQRDKGLKHAA